MKSPKNKTIDLTIEEGHEYLKKCVKVNNKVENEKDILNKTILGDTLKILPLLPDNFVDLLIVDPPYNLSKNYEENEFKAMNDKEYKEYTNLWIEKVKHCLKPTASIYVCCDWKSSLIIGNVLQKYFKIQNRITWQREKGRGAETNWKNGLEDIWFAANSNN